MSRNGPRQLALLDLCSIENALRSTLFPFNKEKMRPRKSWVPPAWPGLVYPAATRQAECEQNLKKKCNRLFDSHPSSSLDPFPSPSLFRIAAHRGKNLYVPITESFFSSFLESSRYEDLDSHAPHEIGRTICCTD